MAESLSEIWRQIGAQIRKAEISDEIVGPPEYDNPYLPKELVPLRSFFYQQDDSDPRIKSIIEYLGRYNASVDRDQRYERIENMLSIPEADGTLNAYADEAYAQAEDGTVFNVFSDDKDVSEIVDTMLHRAGFVDRAWQQIRDMCAFGDDFNELIFRKDRKGIHGLNWVPRELIARVEKNGVLQYFTPKESTRLKANDRSIYYTFYNYAEASKNQELKIEPFRILHFRIPGTKYRPYGTSILDSVLGVLDELKMMEQSLLIARITRAPERRIYQVNVGNYHGEQAMRHALDVVKKLKKKRVLDKDHNNALASLNDFFSSIEDIVIPRRNGEEESKIDTLPQLNDPGQLNDLGFIQSRLFPGLGVPRSYLFDDQMQYSGKSLANQSLPFAKKIRRVQKCYLTQVHKAAVIECRLHGIERKRYEDLIITMNNPSNIDAREKTDLQTALWTLVGTIKGLNTDPSKTFFPDYKIFEKMLGMNRGEILETMKFAAAQNSGVNPFTMLPESERPDGYTILDVIGQKPPQETTPPGGNENPPPAENGNPAIPAEAAAALGGETGTPPAPGTSAAGETAPAPAPTGPEPGSPEAIAALADEHDDDPTDKKEYVESRTEILKKKAMAGKIKFLEKKLRPATGIITEDVNTYLAREQRYTRSNSSLDFFESTGEFGMMSAFINSKTPVKRAGVKVQLRSIKGGKS